MPDNMESDDTQKSEPTLDEGGKLNQRALNGLRLIVGVLLTPIVVFALVVIFLFAVHHTEKANELGLGQLVIFGLTGLALVFIPWEKLGLRITKVGFVEFSQVIKTQKKEEVDNIAALQKQIDALKLAMETKVGLTATETNAWGNLELPEVLIKFFRQHPGFFFGPSRIVNWGGKQEGSKELASFSSATVNQALVKLLSENKVQTKISRWGNTLYGIKRKNL